MAKVAIAKVDSNGTAVGEQQLFVKGDQFPVLEAPIDFSSMMVFHALEANGDLEQATLVAFDDGFIVFFEEETERAWGIHDYFEIKEVA